MVLISSFMITKLFDGWDLMTEYKNRAFQFSDHHEPEQKVRKAPRPGESHGQRSLAGYSPKGHKESDMTEAT